MAYVTVMSVRTNRTSKEDRFFPVWTGFDLIEARELLDQFEDDDRVAIIVQHSTLAHLEPILGKELFAEIMSDNEGQLQQNLN